MKQKLLSLLLALFASIYIGNINAVVVDFSYNIITEFNFENGLQDFMEKTTTENPTPTNATASIVEVTGGHAVKINGDRSVAYLRLHTNAITLEAGKYFLVVDAKAATYNAKIRMGYTLMKPDGTYDYKYTLNATELVMDADFVELRGAVFSLPAETDVTLFIANNGKTGNAIICDNLKLYKYAYTCHSNIIISNNVSQIPANAFEGCTELTSITIPNSVTSIGDYAFSGCTGLTSITIPNSVTSIGDDAFSGCTGLTSITIPNSVTSIGYFAFEECTNLTSVTIPNSVTSVGNMAFYNILNIVYHGTATGSPWGARSVNGYVDGYFVYSDANKTQLLACSSAATGSITIPNSVTSIGASAFRGCTGLTSITIPNSVTSIGDNAFYGCTGLTSITIPSSVMSIGGSAFKGCTSLTSITIPNSVTSIGGYAFSGCTGLTSITIPNSVTSIGEDAFSGCTGLTSVTIPSSVTSIGDYVFRGCTGLTSIIIPSSVTSIGSYAFYQCTGLTSVTIPSSVTSIGSYAFYQCTGLTSVTIPNSVTSIGEDAFKNVPLVVYGGTATGSPWGANEVYAAIDGYFLFNDAVKTNLAKCLPSAAGTISIPSSVTTISNNAFQNCTGITNVIWNFKQFNDFASAEVSPFYDIRAQLNSFEFGEEVEKIPAYLCYGMSNLTSVSLPASVKNIGNNAFADCSALENIYSYRTLPPNAYSTAFDGVDKFSCVLHVPSESIDYYKNAAAWRDFFYVTILGAETAEVTALTITPHEDNADVMWPAVVNAYSYEFTITDSNGNTVCTLTFNANGQLTGLILHAPAAEGVMQRAAAGTGFSFNVTGLENGSSYNLVIKAKDSNGTVLQTFSQDFTTGATALENVSADGASGVRKVIEDGKVIILMPDGRRFDASGRKLR